MKYLLTTTVLIAMTITSFAQKTPALKANKNLSKSEAMAAQQLTLNEHKCHLDHVAIQNNNNGTYDLNVAFERPCDNEKSVTVNFRDLGDAVLVKDLMLKSSGYDFFNLFKEKDGKIGFEIVYSK